MTSIKASARAYALAAIPRDVVQKGFSRTAVAGDSALVTINWLEPGLDLTKPHHHPFDQLSFVLTGTMTFFVAEDIFVLTAPAFIHIPADVPHGASIPADGSIVLNIDVFAPAREDYRYLTEHERFGEPSGSEILPERDGS